MMTKLDVDFDFKNFALFAMLALNLGGVLWTGGKKDSAIAELQSDMNELKVLSASTSSRCINFESRISVIESKLDIHMRDKP